MMAKATDTIAVENARIMFRNFSGKEGKFNPAGRRNFCVFLDTEIAEDLERIGWNVRWLDPIEEGESGQPYLQVSVDYRNIPPKILLVTGAGKTILDEQSVEILDWADIKSVDLIINPYNWEVNGKSGIKAYLKSMYVTIVEDKFAHKYHDIPAAGDHDSSDVF